MRMIVTGGAGFIGSHLIDALLAAGHEVHAVDNLSRGHARNLTDSAGRMRCPLHIVDVCSDEWRAVATFVRPEVVFHLAAQIDVRSSLANPVRDANTNVVGTVNVAEAARQCGTHKIVFASSGGAIYGEHPPRLPTPEAAPPAPSSPYAAAKICGEHYLDTYRRRFGVDCTHLALANVYGPRQNSAGESGVVGLFTWALQRGEPTVIFGDGLNTRDYIYVGDVAEVFRHAAGAGGSGQRYNIGTGVQTSDQELHTAVAKVIGTRDQPTYHPARPGDVRMSALDPTAASRDFGWRPQVDLLDGISRTVSSFASEADHHH